MTKKQEDAIIGVIAIMIIVLTFLSVGRFLFWYYPGDCLFSLDFSKVCRNHAWDKSVQSSKNSLENIFKTHTDQKPATGEVAPSP